MRKIAAIFIIAVLAPSLALAWLAVSSVKDQAILHERQQTLLYQNACSSAASAIREFMWEQQREFARNVQALLAENSPQSLASNFDQQILPVCPVAEVGFAVSLAGALLSPSMVDRPEARQFRFDNELFLCNQESVEVYWNSPKGAVRLPLASNPPAPDASTPELTWSKVRNVSPQQGVDTVSNESNLASAEAEFRQLIGDATEGVLARFHQDKLTLMIWHRPPSASNYVYGAQLNLNVLMNAISPLISQSGSLSKDICVALLDEKGAPKFLTHPNFAADWKRPFVAEEIGEVLPHWEVAAYLLDLESVARSARVVSLTLGWLIALSIIAIGVGGWLIVSDTRRQLFLARQKTTFVSNVSHELKTPLTSIRMFTELLAQGRAQDPSQQRAYLGIISAEVNRLTRLINNVLDFSRMDRGERHYKMCPVDLNQIVRETFTAYRPQLDHARFTLTERFPDDPVWVNGDHDAIAQIVLNLLSNAEKYSNHQKELHVEVARHEENATLLVADRGPGVPANAANRIFEQFYRADDSLSSGVPGSGLGLSLAQQIARAHGGSITYQPRPGGGALFNLSLPLLSPSPRRSTAEIKDSRPGEATIPTS